MTIPSLPHSWSELSWRQLCQCWSIKMRYGGKADVARVAALLELCGCSVCPNAVAVDKTTGEDVYTLCTSDGKRLTTTPRELSYMARQALQWFDWPYGDPGEKEERDDEGKVTKDRREPVAGYVSQMRDAMMLPEEQWKDEYAVFGFRLPVFDKRFALPQVACNNLTWQQYRALQTIAPQLFTDDVSDEDVLSLQAQFLAHSLVPRSFALLDSTGGSIRIRPHYEYRYNAEQASSLVCYWERMLKKKDNPCGMLFHIVFQCYQTALSYYSAVYPLLFGDSGKNDPMRDALTGEVGTINTIMKYAGYAEQQQVYDSNLPFVLDILNTMTKEAKEIEKMNAKIKKNSNESKRH